MTNDRKKPTGGSAIRRAAGAQAGICSVPICLGNKWLSVFSTIVLAIFLSACATTGGAAENPASTTLIDQLGKMGATVKTGSGAKDSDITEIIFLYTHTPRLAPGGATVPPYPMTDDLLLQISKLPLLTHLELNMCPHVTDVGLASLKDMVQLQQLALFGPNVTDVTMGNLAGLTNLTFFRASVAGHVTAKGWAVVANWKKLQSLWVAEGSFGNAQMPHLKELTQLKDITFYGDNINDASADVLLGLPNLTSVRLAPPISKAEEAKLKAALPNCRFWR